MLPFQEFFKVRSVHIFYRLKWSSDLLGSDWYVDCLQVTFSSITFLAPWLFFAIYFMNFSCLCTVLGTFLVYVNVSIIHLVYKFLLITWNCRNMLLDQLSKLEHVPSVPFQVMPPTTEVPEEVFFLSTQHSSNLI